METSASAAEIWVQRALGVLREQAHPVTHQREAVLRFLSGNGQHPSAAEVQRAVPGASRSTVYKTLSLLVELGVADAVPAPSGELRFDPRVDPHDHFYCRSCSELTDLPVGEAKVEVPAHFEVERHRIVVEGRCPECVEAA